MKPIVYKFIMDYKGVIEGVELWQGNNHITVSMMYADGSHLSGYKWTEIKQFLDNVQLPNVISHETDYIGKLLKENIEPKREH